MQGRVCEVIHPRAKLLVSDKIEDKSQYFLLLSVSYSAHHITFEATI